MIRHKSLQSLLAVLVARYDVRTYMYIVRPHHNSDQELSFICVMGFLASV